MRSWLPVPALASGEWLTAATYAAAISDPGATELIRRMLERVEHQTVWTEAAGRTVAAVAAGAAGDHRQAARWHTEAAEIYAGIPDVTDRFFSSCLAAGELRRGPRSAARPLPAEIHAFTARNEAPGPAPAGPGAGRTRGGRGARRLSAARRLRHHPAHPSHKPGWTCHDSEHGARCAGHGLLRIGRSAR